MFRVFEWFGVVLQCDAFVVIVLSGDPKVALLFRLFDFRCGVLLFNIILVIYKY